jgi:hypothetical protein
MGPAAKMPVLLAYEALAAGCDPDIRGRKLHPRGRKTSLKKQSGEGNMVDLALRVSAQLRTLLPPRRGAISK